jgi:outer membrane autotransporter protein
MVGRLHRATLNRFAQGTALVIATLAGIDGAMADGCAPVSGQTNTFSCTGATTSLAGNAFGQSTDTNVTTTLQNNADVVGGNLGILSGDGLTVTVNTGATVKGTNGGIQSGSGLTVTNMGTIDGGTSVGIFGQSGAVTNSGSISGVIGIQLSSTANVTNLAGGQISGTVGGGLELDGSATVINSGLISGRAFGIDVVGTATVTNNAGARIQNLIASGGGLALEGGTVNNSGIISGFQGVVSNDLALVVVNSGQIEGGGSGIVAGADLTVTNNSRATISSVAGNAIQSAGAVTLANTGLIQATGAGGIGIQGATINLTSNSGTIKADSTAVSASGNDTSTLTAVTVNNSGFITSVHDIAVSSSVGSATVNNSGTISASSAGVFALGGVTVTNSGHITSTNGAAIASDAGATVNNSGIVTGVKAIVAQGAATITNSGTIASTSGATGTAIQLSHAADTLNIKNGSIIIGKIDMGGGADVINVDAPPSILKGVSVLARSAAGVVDALRQQLVNFTSNDINIVGGGTLSVQPTVTVGGLTASLDPTAMAQQDRTLMDFTGGMSSMVQGRLAGSATGSGPMAMSYAMDDGKQMLSKAPVSSWNAPVTVWSSMFGASRSQNGTDTTLNSTSSVFGGVIGVDRRIQPNWLVGAFLGGGSGSLNVDLSSQKINTDYFSGGVYSRYEWASQFFDATLQAGSMNNRSSRLVQNTLTGAGENATANYNGWFISPEVAYGYRIKLGDTTVTPTFRARYVAGTLDGYNETGSAQTLSVGSRTLQDFEERAEVEVSRTGFFGDPSLKGWFRGGAIALQRVGDTTVNAVLIGQSLSFVTPGKNSAVGGVGGVGFDYHLTPNVALFGALEGMMMSDESRVGSARGGVKVAF